MSQVSLLEQGSETCATNEHKTLEPCLIARHKVGLIVLWKISTSSLWTLVIFRHARQQCWISGFLKQKTELDYKPKVCPGLQLHTALCDVIGKCQQVSYAGQHLQACKKHSKLKYTITNLPSKLIRIFHSHSHSNHTECGVTENLVYVIWFVIVLSYWCICHF